MDLGTDRRWQAKYTVLRRKCREIERGNERLARKMYKTKKVLEHLKRERSILMQKLDHYEDSYREAAKEFEASAIANLTATPHFAVTPDADLSSAVGSQTSLPPRAHESDGHFPEPNAHITSGRKSATKIWSLPGSSGTPMGKKVAGRMSTSPLVGAGRGTPGSAGKTERDPNAPKKPSNAFFMFCQSHRTSIQEECHQSEMTGHHDLTKLMAKKWKELPADEKKIYYDMYEKDKARYASELRDYQKTQHGSSANSGQTTPLQAKASVKKSAATPAVPQLPSSMDVSGFDDSDDSSGPQPNLQIDCAFPPVSQDPDSDEMM